MRLLFAIRISSNRPILVYWIWFLYCNPIYCKKSAKVCISNDLLSFLKEKMWDRVNSIWNDRRHLGISCIDHHFYLFYVFQIFFLFFLNFWCDHFCYQNKGINFWSVQHVGRDTNTAAHKLAQYAALREDEQMWTSNFPDFIYSIVISDLEGSWSVFYINTISKKKKNKAIYCRFFYRLDILYIYVLFFVMAV